MDKRTELSLNLPMDKEEKEHINAVYRKNSINKTARVLELIRADVKKMEGTEEAGA